MKIRHPDTVPTRTAHGANPLGGRARRRVHREAEDRAQAFEGLPRGENRFMVVRLLRRIGRKEGWTQSMIAHLNLLIENTRPHDWLPGAHPIVWLSVQRTARELSISAVQVWRNEQEMLKLGAIAYRDSPNHRRYGRRGGDDRIVEAYGVDLSPIAGLMPHLAAAAKATAEHEAEWYRLKRNLTVARRHIRAALHCAVLDGDIPEEAAETIRQEMASFCPRLSQTTPLDVMRLRLQNLEGLDECLRAAVEKNIDPEDDRPAKSNGQLGRLIEPAASQAPETMNPGDPPAPNPLPGTTPNRKNESHGLRQRKTPIDYNTTESKTVNLVGKPDRKEEDSSAGRAVPTDGAGASPAWNDRVPFRLLVDILPPLFVERLPPDARISWSTLTDAAPLEAMIVDGTPDETRLIEIDENLARAELTALERARFLTARKEIYERAHPEASRGGDRKSLDFKGKNQTANLAVWSEAAGTDQTRQAAAPSYAEDTRARTGISVRTIRRAVYIGDSLSEEMAAALSGTPLADRQTDLEQIIAMPELKRRKVIEYCRTSKPPPKTLSEVLRAIGKTASTSETTPELNALKRAWMKATPRTRKRFVQWLRAQDRGAPL